MSTQPLWQEMTGLTPEKEDALTLDQRDEAIRKLIAEVDRTARIEFSRGDKTPAGERTAFWDPLERICKYLGISRTKLSSFARELTGMRAHELTDRIKAEDLPARVRAQLEKWLPRALEVWAAASCDYWQLPEHQYHRKVMEQFVERAQKVRAGLQRPRWALELGFANPSRLGRACLLAQQIGIDELEANIVWDMVQKFLNALVLKQRAHQTPPPALATPNRRTTPAPEPSIEEEMDAVATAHGADEPLSAETQEIIDDAVAHVMRKFETRVA